MWSFFLFSLLSRFCVKCQKQHDASLETNKQTNNREKRTQKHPKKDISVLLSPFFLRLIFRGRLRERIVSLTADFLRTYRGSQRWRVLQKCHFSLVAERPRAEWQSEAERRHWTQGGWRLSLSLLLFWLVLRLEDVLSEAIDAALEDVFGIFSWDCDEHYEHSPKRRP